MSAVHGVIVIARNGDRMQYYQDPETYQGAFTQTTALGAVQAHQLGDLLRSTYLDPNSETAIQGIKHELVDNTQIHMRIKGGSEGTVVFDSSIALLQGLYPPTPKNKIVLANETTVTAPLGGYQYVPVETVEPSNDRSLESWTDCPAFEKHVQKVYASEEFQKKAKDAEPFFNSVKDFVFGRPTTLKNAWNIYDHIHSELQHNKTFAYRLPPTYQEQARHLADFHENAVFSDVPGGIGNIAGRTLLHTILSSLQRVAFNGDPLQLMLVGTTYQPFISLFHETEMVKNNPELQGIPNYASALVIELRKGAPPEDREFLRFRFKNGTASNFQTLPVFGHHSDIPLTEFIYKIQNKAITSNEQWKQVCNGGSAQSYTSRFIGASTDNVSVLSAMIAFIFFLGLFTVAKTVRRSRQARRLALHGEERLPTVQSGKF